MFKFRKINYIEKYQFKVLKQLEFKSIKKVLSLEEFQAQYMKQYYNRKEFRFLRRFLDIGSELLKLALRKRRLLKKFLEIKYKVNFIKFRRFTKRFLLKRKRLLKRKLNKKRVNLRMKFYFRINYENLLLCLNLSNKQIIIRSVNFFNSLIFYKSYNFRKFHRLRKKKYKYFRIHKITKTTRKRRKFLRRRKRRLRFRFKKRFLIKRFFKRKIKQFSNFLRFISFFNLCKKINLKVDDNFKIKSIFYLPYKLFRFNKIENSYKFFIFKNKKNKKLNIEFLSKTIKIPINKTFNLINLKLKSRFKIKPEKQSSLINIDNNFIDEFLKFENKVFDINYFSFGKNDIFINEIRKNLIFKSKELTIQEKKFLFSIDKPILLNFIERKKFIFNIETFSLKEKLQLIDKNTLTLDEKIKLNYKLEEQEIINLNSNINYEDNFKLDHLNSFEINIFNILKDNLLMLNNNNNKFNFYPHDYLIKKKLFFDRLLLLTNDSINFNKLYFILIKRLITIIRLAKKRFFFQKKINKLKIKYKKTIIKKFFKKTIKKKKRSIKSYEILFTKLTNISKYLKNKLEREFINFYLNYLIYKYNFKVNIFKAKKKKKIKRYIKKIIFFYKRKLKSINKKKLKRQNILNYLLLEDKNFFYKGGKFYLSFKNKYNNQRTFPYFVFRRKKRRFFMRRFKKRTVLLRNKLNNLFYLSFNHIDNLHKTNTLILTKTSLVKNKSLLNSLFVKKHLYNYYKNLKYSHFNLKLNQTNKNLNFLD